MKALKLSTIALCLLGILNSCTKDTVQSSSTTSSSSSSLEGVLGTNGKGPNDVQPTTGNDKTDVSLVVTYDPTIGIKGQDVTVTGTFADGSAVPDCGQLQLEQLVNGTYMAVESPVDVTPANHEVTYTFPATVVGEAAYSFRVHYVASGGKCDFNQKMSDGFPLTVVASDCDSKLHISGVATMTGQPDINGLAEFTVVYTVKTCGLEFTKLKVQGGLTNGVSDVTAVGGEYGQQRVPGSSTNKIITWEESSTDGSFLPTALRTYTIKFKKAYSGTGTIELTGDWSVSISPANDDQEKAIYPKIYLPQ